MADSIPGSIGPKDPALVQQQGLPKAAPGKQVGSLKKEATPGSKVTPKIPVGTKQSSAAAFVDKAASKPLAQVETPASSASKLKPVRARVDMKTSLRFSQPPRNAEDASALARKVLGPKPGPLE